VTDIVFDRDSLLIPALSPQHYRANLERTAGPIVKMIELLSATDPEKLSAFRREFDAVVSRYYRQNMVHQGYLITRARLDLRPSSAALFQSNAILRAPVFDTQEASERSRICHVSNALQAKAWCEAKCCARGRDDTVAE
jgi:hypothetical protein